MSQQYELWLFTEISEQITNQPVIERLLRELMKDHSQFYFKAQNRAICRNDNSLFWYSDFFIFLNWEYYQADLLYLTLTSSDEIHDGMNLELYYQ